MALLLFDYNIMLCLTALCAVDLIKRKQGDYEQFVENIISDQVSVVFQTGTAKNIRDWIESTRAFMSIKSRENARKRITELLVLYSISRPEIIAQVLVLYFRNLQYVLEPICTETCPKTISISKSNWKLACQTFLRILFEHRTTITCPFSKKNRTSTHFLTEYIVDFFLPAGTPVGRPEFHADVDGPFIYNEFLTENEEYLFWNESMIEYGMSIGVSIFLDTQLLD